MTVPVRKFRTDENSGENFCRQGKFGGDGD